MPLIPAPSAAPSKRPYAFKLDTFAQDRNGRWSVDAVWLGRKSGQTRISYGAFSFWWQGRGVAHTDSELGFADLAAHCDERYGGDPWYVCNEDGNLWVNPSPQTPSPSLQEQISIVEDLTAMLQGLPDVPDGFTGWYHLVDHARAQAVR